MSISSSSPWARYEPTADDPWDLRKVAHLHRRAGFGANRAELTRDLAAGPVASIDRFFEPAPISTEEADVLESLRQTARTSRNLDLLKVGWLNRILEGRDPLVEKMTLFWHSHFATSNKKVDSIELMDRQNQTLRAHAMGGFAGLLEAMIADPAMLVWLDGGTSKKEKPNENFAREFLELFTLGPGHYTEADIRETARAFTGWNRHDATGDSRVPSFTRDPALFDDGTKTILGKTGRWSASDIVRITLECPEAAVFMARKLYRFFVSEAGEPGAELIDPLAEEIRKSKFVIRPIIEVILRSRHFYGQSAYRQRIKSPVEFSAGLVRVLEVPSAAFNPLALAAACELQGQELFAPPNVAGWEGGTAWINSGTLLARGNWSADVVWGRPDYGLAPFDPLAWAARYSIKPDQAADALVDLLLGRDLASETRKLVTEPGRGGTLDGLRKVLQRIVNCAEFQLA